MPSKVTVSLLVLGRSLYALIYSFILFKISNCAAASSRAEVAAAIFSLIYALFSFPSPTELGMLKIALLLV